MDRLEALGEGEWFRLGDRDLATHIWRTDRLRAGDRPTEVALELATAMGITSRILPMADEPVRTEVRTDDGWLEFQEYFVHRHQEPTVHEVRFRGIENARPTPEVLAAIEAAEVIVIAPSNPVVSIDPILSLPGCATRSSGALGRGVPIVAVSGIIGGKALKGPADRMLASLGEVSSAVGVAARYEPLISHFVMDQVDAALLPALEALGVDDARDRHDHDRRRGTGQAGRRGPPVRGHRGDLVIVAIIPIGSIDGAKSRLGAVLDAEERRDLALRLARGTIRAAVATPGIDETIVVTPDDEVRELALREGARPMRQRSRGLNDGLREARDEAIAAGADAILVLPIDIPHVSPDLLSAARRAGARRVRPARRDRARPPRPRHQRAPSLTPRRDRLLLRRRQQAAHIEAGSSVPGANVVLMYGPLTLDIDTPEDLLLAQVETPEAVGG